MKVHQGLIDSSQSPVWERYTGLLSHRDPLTLVEAIDREYTSVKLTARSKINNMKQRETSRAIMFSWLLTFEANLAGHCMYILANAICIYMVKSTRMLSSK